MTTVLAQSSHRWIIAAALLTVLALATWALIGGSSSYRVVAHFSNAGQLVKGGRVEVSGRPVGEIVDVRVGSDGNAEVEFSIDEGRFVPLRRGTRADIRAVGQAGVTNRYLDLTPSPVGGAEIPDGGSLSLQETSGIVELDAIFSAFDEPTRDSVAEVASRSAEIFAGSGSRWFNGMLTKLSPAFEQFAAVSSDLNADRAQLDRLIGSLAETSKALASQPGATAGAIRRTASVLAQVDTVRPALVDDLERLPPVVAQATGTLGTLRQAVPAIRAALRRVPAAAKPLGTVLSRVQPTAVGLKPVIADARSLLPDLETSLRGFKPLEQVARPALTNLGEGLKVAIPVLEAVRVYTPDLILGVIGGFAALSASRYDALGKYGRLIITEGPETVPYGAARLLDLPDLPGLKLRTGITAPCPGAAAPRAPDNSNVWVPNPDLCDPKQRVYGK